MDEVEAAAELHGHAPVPQFAEQAAPFWHVGQPGSAAAARADGTNTRRAMSSEQLKSDQRWFAKPEQYPVVSPAEPRADDAFKLSAAEKRFLTRKLSSGPKRAQRGYPPELVALTEKVTAAFKIILSDPAVEGILVNIFGGIMKCDIIADGIVAAAKEVNLQVTLVVRLAGTNVEKGKEIINNSDVDVIAADNLSDGAEKIVKAVKG